MAPPPALQQEPPYAYVIEYRALDRCAPPLCRLGARAVHGYAAETMEDGDPGSYVTQGGGITSEQVLQRGVRLAPGESFELDLPPATWVSELDAFVAPVNGSEAYDASVFVLATESAKAPVTIAEEHYRGRSVPFTTPKAPEAGRTDRYGTHVRLRLPSRVGRTLKIRIRNDGAKPMSLGAPVVMRRVEGRGPRQIIIAAHDAVPFHMARALLHDGLGEAKTDWVKKAVAERGLYFPMGQSCGQGTSNFVIRFFTGDYHAPWGWPAMFGNGFDETLPETLPGPIARAAEQGFTAVFVGNNFTILPNFGNIGFDVGYQSELKHHTPGMARYVEGWAAERPNDDLVMVWWTSQTHSPYDEGRKGAKPLMPPLPPREINLRQVNGVWRNLLDTVDQLEVAYGALRAAAPHAARVMWIGADHSSAVSSKMQNRSFRTPLALGTGVMHAVGGTVEEMTTPFALIFDDESHAWPHGSRVVEDRVSSLVTWKAVESFFGIDLRVPRISTHQWSFSPDSNNARIWDDRVLVSFGSGGVLRALKGDLAYTQFQGKISQAPVWTIPASQQFAMFGSPIRTKGMSYEELYDDAADPYEYKNLAGDRLDTVLDMRREATDWMAAHWDDHDHPRHRYKLLFPEVTDVELFAPHPFTALVNETPVPTGDPRVARVRAQEIVILETAEAAGIVEIRGLTAPAVLKCSANGLPLDVVDSSHPRLNLVVARTNCPLPEYTRAVAAPGEIVFSFEPARPPAGGGAHVAKTPGSPARNTGSSDDLMSGMKRWGYVRDLGDKKKK